MSGAGFPKRYSLCPYIWMFTCDESSYEFQALSLIADSLPHPQRSILSDFIRNSADREVAAYFFLSEIGQNSTTIEDFLSEWITLLRKVQPVECKDMDPSLRQNIWLRDGGKCCISFTENDERDRDPLVVHILSPTTFQDEDMIRNGRLDNLFAAFIGRSQVEYLKSLLNQDFETLAHDTSEQLMLLSTKMFEHWANGRVSLKPSKRSASNTFECLTGRLLRLPGLDYSVPWKTTLLNRATEVSSLPNPQLLQIHSRFASALAWLEVSEYMKRNSNSTSGSTSQGSVSLADKLLATSWVQRFIQPISATLRYLWLQVPAFLRASAYKYLLQYAVRTNSACVYRLPFNIYLRIDNEESASKHQAEFRTLQIIEKHTRIPAPKGIDVVFYSGTSYLLMTACPGRAFGTMMPTLTDEQVDNFAQELKGYITEMRKIPKDTGSETRICNSLGGGIFDFRIQDSVRKVLIFEDEAELNKYLTSDVFIEEENREMISKAHSIKHSIVFTHADLHAVNIRVDDTGKITGIIDWETAGWYPEHWEYVKMRFTNLSCGRWMADVTDVIFTDYREELEADKLIQSHLPGY